jgi:hypothetical protein
MPKFMKTETALARLAEDEEAPVGSRCNALRQLTHPPLTLLRRLLADTPRATPVPPKLKAIATLKFAFEVQYRKTRASRAARQPKKQDDSASNALGIN